MTIYRKIIDNIEQLEMLSKAHYTEQALDPIIKSYSGNGEAYSVLLDKYTKAFADKQTIMAIMEKEYLREAANRFAYTTNISFSERYYDVYVENANSDIDKLMNNLSFEKIAD